jgi:hypothetical protein
LEVVFFFGIHLNHLACFLCHLLSYHSNDGFIPTFKELFNLLFFSWLEKLIYRWRLTKNAITSWIDVATSSSRAVS